MPVDNSVAYVAAERSKSIRKPHWREKLFSKDKNKGTSEAQIEAFLGTARASPTPTDVPPAAPSLPKPVPAPRLNISTHNWPSSHDLSSPSPVSNPSSAPDPYAPVKAPNKPKSGRRRGLRVRFSNRGPDVIGEGGDEAEDPPLHISVSHNRSRSSSSDQSEYLSPQQERFSPPTLPQLRINTVASSRDQGKDNAKGLHADDWRPLLHNPQDAELLMALGSGRSGSRLSFRASPESNSFAQRVRARMQAEEGRALQKGYNEPSSPSNGEEPDSHEFVTVPTSPSSLFGTSPVAAKTGPFNVSHTPHPALAIHKQSDASPVESPIDRRPSPNRFPAASTPKHSPPQPGPVPAEPPTYSRPLNAENRNKSTSRSPQPLPQPPFEPSPKPAPQPVSQPPKASLRSIANQFGEIAFDELETYVARYSDMFKIAAEHSKPLAETSLPEWIRAAVWWFLRGKKRLESYARTPSSSPVGAEQAVLDLGKALWINQHVIPQNSELQRYGVTSVDALFAVANTTGDTKISEILSQYQALMSHIRSLAISIKRHSILSTISSHPTSTDRLDTSLWLEYPMFAPDVSAVLSGMSSRSMLVERAGKTPSTAHMMPVGDTSRFFSYGNMFVEVYVSSRDDDDSQSDAMPCALSIIRDPSDWYVFAAITSQSHLINILIQSDRKQGPTWDDVTWHVSRNSIEVKLPRGFQLDVMFQEDDFKMIWNIVQYTRRTEASLHPRAGENLIFSNTLKTFQYMDPGPVKAFPAERSERCRIALFERSVQVTQGTGTRTAHRGFRLAVVTSPKTKTLSNVQHILGYDAPIVFGLLRGEDGVPALMLKVTEDGRARSMVLGFHEVEERTTMQSLLLAMGPDDMEFRKVTELSIRSYTIEQPPDMEKGQPAVTHLQLPSGNVSVIDLEHVVPTHSYGPTILSEHLRVFVASEFGSVTDRINLGPGELKLGLDANKKTGLSLYRPGQEDLTVAVAENLVNKDTPAQLTAFVQKAKVTPMIRKFEFSSSEDLHAFEEAVTGFRVLFDGFSSSFTISRRRMVVPIYKKWEATQVRIQVVQQEKVIQLLAFFSDFSHGQCMNFVLKGTDVLEVFNRAGKFGIRVVDAKFALPKNDGDPASEFLCLDMPEYPIEHDDISILFNSETGRRTGVGAQAIAHGFPQALATIPNFYFHGQQRES
ncbi:hypothetical protein MPDQ_002371 [Monascus purpureus]|uniref:Uncharacterized protein n=1 Tax=Monascus purpureus TaxID=5098 RepID=A0A507QKM7_MONPU|nr:hypothetical protein MPDQ_002371 [Monascus purpureus]